MNRRQFLGATSLCLVAVAAQAAISLRNCQTGTSGADTNSVTINKPTSLADGDMVDIVVYMYHGSATSLAPVAWTGGSSAVPTGFTLTYQAPAVSTLARQMSVFRKVITSAAGEPSTYTLTHAGGATWSIVGSACAYVGVNTSTPQDAAAVETQNAAATTVAFADITTVTAGAWLITPMIARRALTITYNDSITEDAEVSGGDAADVSNQVTGSVGHLLISSPGATGAKTGTLSGARESVSFSYALRPSGGTTPLRRRRD